MGCTNLFSSEEGWVSPIHIQLPQTQQTDQAKALSYTKDSRHAVETGRFPICNKSGFKHGLLSH
jgi:hypothetical protein